VAEPVYLRVRGDYETRNRELDQKAAPLKQQARVQYLELSSLLDRYTGDHEAITLDRQEIELRHQLGEFDDAEFKRRIAELETELAARADALERAQQLKAAFLEAFHSEAELQMGAVTPPAAAAPSAPTPAPPPVPQSVPPPPAATPGAGAPTMPAGFRTLETEPVGDQTQVFAAMPPMPPAPPPPPAAATLAAAMPPPPAKPARPPSETQMMPVLDIPLPTRNSAAPAPPSGATVVVRAARLVPQNPEAGRNSVMLNLNSVSIGADAANDIRVGGPGVDGKHAQLTVSMAGYTVVDLGSPHGTRVNAEKIRERLLRDQDVIQVGAARWVFREG
jgi:hypothetical protein